MKHVFIAVPAYTGTIHLPTCRAIIATITALLARGDRFTLWDDSGSAMIGHSRSLTMAHFLASGATHCLCIDHDVVFSSQDALRLIDSGWDFCAGVYPQRRDPVGFCVGWATGPDDDLIADPLTGFLEVGGIGAGFMCLSRECVQRMWNAYKDTKRFDSSDAPSGWAVAMFDNIHDGHTYYGEDISFCKRWRDIGGKVWIDPEMNLGHIGNKMFTGHLGDHLRKINNISDQPRSAQVA